MRNKGGQESKKFSVFLRCFMRCRLELGDDLMSVNCLLILFTGEGSDTVSRRFMSVSLQTLLIGCNRYVQRFARTTWNKTEIKYCRRTIEITVILFQFYCMLCEPLKPTNASIKTVTVQVLVPSWCVPLRTCWKFDKLCHYKLQLVETLAAFVQA